MDDLGLKEMRDVSMRVVFFTADAAGGRRYVDSTGETHVDLVAVEKVDVGFVLLFVLTHQQQHGGVMHQIQDRLAQVDGGEGEVLQLLLQQQHGEAVSD